MQLGVSLKLSPIFGPVSFQTNLSQIQWYSRNSQIKPPTYSRYFFACTQMASKKVRKSYNNWTKFRPRQDSNLESSDPKSDALSIRPRGRHTWDSETNWFWSSVLDVNSLATPVHLPSPVLRDDSGTPGKTTAKESGINYLTSQPVWIKNQQVQTYSAPDNDQEFLFYPIKPDNENGPGL